MSRNTPEAGTRTMTARAVQDALRALADPGDALHLQRFFKTGPGQYGEGDVFIGVRVPATRAAIKGFADLPLAELAALLDSEAHEDRLAALLILVGRAARAARPRGRDDALRGELARFFLDAVHRGRVNNWDLVDSSAEFLLGEALFDKIPVGAGPAEPPGGAAPALLLRLARSADLWERRVAVLSTFAFIKHGEASATLELAELLLGDREDLMHKAVGWMLREVGKRVDRGQLTAFLDAHAPAMPRTMLSYAVEHLEPELRAHYRSLA